MGKKTKIVLISFFIIVAIWFATLYGVLKFATHLLSCKFEEKKYSLNILKSSIYGLRTLNFEDIIISNQKGDTTLTIDSLRVSFKIFPLFIGNIRFSNIEIGNLEFCLEKINKKSIYSTSNNEQKETPQQTNYNNITSHFFDNYFSLFPQNARIGSFKISHTSDTLDYSLLFNGFVLANNYFKGIVETKNQINNTSHKFSGFIDTKNNIFTFSSSDTAHQHIYVPSVKKESNVSTGFDSIFISVHFSKGRSESTIDARAFAKKFAINSSRIATTPVIIDSSGFSLKIILAENTIKLDSSSTFIFNRIQIHTSCTFKNFDSTKWLNIKVLPTKIPSQNLFESLPGSLFHTLNGIQTSGTLNYLLNFDIDLQNPDSVRLDSKLCGEGFKLIRFGRENFSKINHTFFHQVVVNGALIDSFRVGPENPNFVYLHEISPFLQNTVLTAEDGCFFFHNGFNEEAFANSISSNIKEKRFARGGSTISMQLVKNVFLSRNKTISRKLEEMLIVWLIENQRLVSKERMYEVYLNIIEWAPGVYGIKKASNFYFKKHPFDLSLSESIYLSSLVPRPKYFSHTYDKNGNMREYFKYFYQVLPPKMISSKRLLPEDTIGLNCNIAITGIAANLIEKQDSIEVSDTLFIQ